MKKIVFLADAFAEEYTGGAELTTKALTQSASSDTEIIKIKCSHLTKDLIEKYQNSHWVILNFALLTKEHRLDIIKNITYSIVEYDYKFCNFRSLELHKLKTFEECDCIHKKENKINLAFYGYAKRIWFMSDIQKDIFLENVKTIKEENTKTLNSVFSSGDLRFIDSIKDNEKDENYIIVKTSSWIKGVEDSIKYAQERKLKYEVVSDLPYQELLIKLSISKGLIFLPVGGDTCPRLVMEAQMLGCETILNDNVQHRNEEWAKNSISCRNHMSTRCSTFWGYYE